MHVAIVSLIILLLIAKNANGMNKKDFLLYGHVEGLMEHKDCLCKTVLAVEIGKHNWQQQMNGRFYAFKIPQDFFSQMTGVVFLNLYRQDKFVKSLWRGYFVVEEDRGAQRLDINVIDDNTCDCEERVVRGKEEYTGNGALVLVISGVMMLLPPSDNSNGKVYQDQVQVQDLIPLPMLPGTLWHPFCTTSTTTEEFKPRVTCLWHLLILLYAVARLMVRLMCQIVEVGKPVHMEWNRAGDGKSWAMSTVCASGDGNDHVALVSGEGRYGEAWPDAEHHLKKMELECCFYFNSSHPNKLKPEGHWNRDAFGRLIRQKNNV
eukprot:Gb_17420 [translate_table: standard]